MVFLQPTTRDCTARTSAGLSRLMKPHDEWESAHHRRVLFVFCPEGILHHPSKNDRGFIGKGIAPEGATYALLVTAFRRSVSRTRLASRVTQSVNKQGRLKKREVNRLLSSRDKKSGSECVEYHRSDAFGTDGKLQGVGFKTKNRFHHQ